MWRPAGRRRAAQTPGEKIALEVWREGRSVRVDATLADAEGRGSRAAKATAATEKGGLGLALAAAVVGRRPWRAGGLVVEQASGPAAAAGVLPGDVVIAVNGSPATSVDAVRETVASSGGSVALLISRNGERIFVPVRIG